MNHDLPLRTLSQDAFEPWFNNYSSRLFSLLLSLAFSIQTASTMVSNPVGDLTVRLSIAFGVIDTVAVALRLLARTRTKASLAADDALITASLIPLYGMIVIGYLSPSKVLRIAGGFADLDRRRNGRNGIDHRVERGARTSGFDAPETYDAGRRDSTTISTSTIKL